MLKKIMICVAMGLFLNSCVAIPNKKIPPTPQEIIVRVQAVDPTNVAVSKEGGQISRSMEVSNPKGSLSRLSFISKDTAFMKIFAGLSVSDVQNLWNDFVILEHDTDVRKVELFINSPGGDAFSGIALANQLECAIKKGFTITAHASGIIASAAVPVLAVCNVRLAAPGTIFMVHEAALWKWSGRETASEIKSQTELMKLLREQYIGILAANSKLGKKEWKIMEKSTTWFSVEKAEKWGIIDDIE